MTFLAYVGAFYLVCTAVVLAGFLAAWGAAAHDAPPRAPRVDDADPIEGDCLPAWRNADAHLADRMAEDAVLAFAEPNLSDEQRRAVLLARHRARAA